MASGTYQEVELIWGQIQLPFQASDLFWNLPAKEKKKKIHN